MQQPIAHFLAPPSDCRGDGAAVHWHRKAEAETAVLRNGSILRMMVWWARGETLLEKRKKLEKISDRPISSEESGRGCWWLREGGEKKIESLRSILTVHSKAINWTALFFISWKHRSLPSLTSASQSLSRSDRFVLGFAVVLQRRLFFRVREVEGWRWTPWLPAKLPRLLLLL